MAVKLGDAIVFIKGNLDQLKKDFGDGERDTKSWTERMGNTASRLLGVGIAGAAGIAAAGVTALAGTFAKATMEAVGLEGVKNTFESLADGATLAKMRTATMNTVLDADLMKTYNRAVLSVGQSFADDLPNAMQYMGKIAGATGQDVSYLLESYQLGIARLSPMILDNLGIQTNLTAANEDYAKKNGLVVESLTKEQQQMALNEQVMGLLASKTADMADTSNSAAVKLQQAKVLFGNLFTQLGSVGLPILTAFLTPLVDLALKVGPDISAWLERASNLIGIFITNVQNGADPLNSFTTLLAMLGVPPEVVNGFNALVGVVQNVSNVIGMLLTGDFAGLWATISAWFGAQDWGALVAAAVAGLSTLGTQLWTAVSPTLATWWTTISTWFTTQDWGGIATTAVTTIINGLGQFLIDVVAQLDSWATAFATWAATVDWNNVGFTVVTAIIDGLSNFVSSIGPTLAGWYSSISSFVGTQDWGGVAGQIVQGIASGITAAGGAVLTALGGVVDGAIAAIKAKLGISSPSKVMALTVGKPMAEGIAAGWLGEQKAIQGMMAGSVQKMVTSTIHNAFNLQVNVQSPQQAQVVMDNFAFRKAWAT